METKLPYGIKNGSLTTIDEVDNGLKCACNCPACHSKLVARKGDIKAHHFAHYKSPDCNAGLETVLHKLCKDIIAKEENFTVPALYLDYYNRRYEIFPETKIHIDDLRIEKKFDSI